MFLIVILEIGVWAWRNSQESLPWADARTAYQFFNLKMQGSWSTQYSFLGASPDGFIYCDCCGRGILEVKCPFCKRDTTLSEDSYDKAICLEPSGAGNLQLVITHMYFYQVQVQITLKEFCDFVVWTKVGRPHIHRTGRDNTFQSNLESILSFYKYRVLPELLANWYTLIPCSPSLPESAF